MDRPRVAGTREQESLMNDIRTLLRQASRRLELTRFLSALNVVAIIAGVVVAVLAVADRLPAAAFVPWVWVAPALGVLAACAALAVWSRRRASEIEVAVEVDQRLDLRERLSTALHCRDRDDAFAMAAVEDAVTVARDPRSRETLRRRFAVSAPQRWWVTPLLLAFAGGVLLMEPLDLFASDEPDAEQTRRVRAETDQTLEAIVKVVEDKPQLKAELASLVEELSPEGARQIDEPENIKRTALKKVTELNRKLDEIVNGEKGKTVRALKDMLSGLEPPDDGPGRELAEALADGNFEAAKQAMEKMLAEIEAGEMDEATKEKLAAQLEQLAEQLEKLASQQKALEEALQRAGMNPQLAQNPEALKQAIEQAQNLNEQQRQQLQQMMQAQQAAQQMCEGLGGACKGLGEAMQGGQLGQGAQQMMNQLDAMEQMQQLLQQAQAAANQAQAQGMGLGQGMNLAQALEQWGPGMRGPGQGAGGTAPLSRTPVGTKIIKADTPTVEGEIIASMLIDGVPIRGESKAKLKQVVEGAAEGFDEALNEDQLPRRYHEAQKHYFGELQRQVEAVTTVEETPPADPPGAGEGSGAASDETTSGG
ncbi:MAG: hypothetical protein HKO59_09095 [Phycisphaerales bacterium]|nr:hypothetical protein [Phycisphaerae bacterium]NNF44501.1 hypothetical protein [Phycisphaerales bacterium]NNM26125.1 hypothetical protein [Phycisphaerales bacterium]